MVKTGLFSTIDVNPLRREDQWACSVQFCLATEWREGKVEAGKEESHEEASG